MWEIDKRDFLKSVEHSYTDFLKDVRFFSYMDGRTYNEVIAWWLPHGNCHILSKILQSRLQDTLSGREFLIDIVWPKTWEHSEYSVEYQYHTAVIVSDSQWDLALLLDPWSFFLEPIVLEVDKSIEYGYTCIQRERTTSIILDSNNILTHQTHFPHKSLIASMDMLPLSDAKIQSLFDQHQAYEELHHNPTRPQRNFVVNDRQWFVVWK